MSKYDLYRNTICKDNDNDYIILFKDEESAKIVFDEFKQKDQRIAELEKQVKIKELAFLNEIPHWDYYYDWEKFEDEERQLYIKTRLEKAEEDLKNREGK